MSIVDALWVGRLGKIALAAVGVSGSVFGVLIALSQLSTAGTMAFVARYTGAKDVERARVYLFNGLVVAVVLGIVIAVAGIPLSRSILTLFGSGKEVVAIGTPYLIALFSILPIVYMSTVIYTGLQATGDSLSPLIVSFLANVINIALDPLFIFGWLGFPKLGVLGAGVATGIASFSGLILAVVTASRKRLLTFVVPKIQFIWSFLKIGFFALIQGITRPLTGMLMFSVAAVFGVTAQAAFTVGLRIIGIPFIFLVGLSVATQSLVGQSLGEGSVSKAEGVVRSSYIAGILLQFFLSLAIFLGARWLVSLFSPGQAEVIDVGSRYLRIVAPFLLFVPLSNAWMGAQYGAGYTIGPAVASVIGNWAVKLPLALILGIVAKLETSGIWLAIGISVVAETAVNGIFFSTGRWKKVAV
ncbi:MATE family efflux transporter [bacterium]|nr:MATE family efflux transporter [bacterium]